MSRADTTPPLIVRVHWLDHHGPYGLSDHRPRRADLRLVKRVTVGWLVRENDKALIVAGTLDEHGFADCNTLGKGLIEKVEYL